MSSEQNVTTPKDTPINIDGGDLPLYCPGPKSPLWSMHPRVYIEIAHDGNAICPYCSAHYVVDRNTIPSEH